MKSLLSVLIVLVITMTSGCAWQRIPAAPEQIVEAPIPLRIGIVFADDKASAYYGAAVLKEWKEMKLFKTLIYPYRETDQIDALMKLTINGGWTGSGGGKGIIIGLTLGLAGTVIGPSMTGSHVAEIVMSKPSNSLNKAGQYSVNVTTEVEWGLFANTSEVSSKAEELQIKRIAVELAKKIRADRQTLLSQLGARSP